MTLTICLFSDDIKNLYYKLMIENHFIENYLKKLDRDKMITNEENKQ
jgi:hypothetical protein